MSKCKRDIFLILGYSFILLMIVSLLFCSKSNVHHFSQSIKYANQATRISNSGESYEFINPEDMDAIVKLKKKALTEARFVDIKDLNRHYPDFGNHYRDEFINGLELYIEGFEKNDTVKLLAGQMLDEKWGVWYEKNVDAIRGR